MTYGVFSVLNNEPNSVLRHSVETEIDVRRIWDIRRGSFYAWTPACTDLDPRTSFELSPTQCCSKSYYIRSSLAIGCTLTFFTMCPSVRLSHAGTYCLDRTTIAEIMLTLWYVFIGLCCFMRTQQIQSQYNGTIMVLSRQYVTACDRRTDGRRVKKC